jgi:PAS domain S-box-containing protein
VFNQQGVITHWNTEAEHLFGWSRIEAVGKTLDETIIPNQPRNGPWNALGHYFTNPNAVKAKQRLEVTARHRDGGEFPVEIAITPTPRGEELWFSAFIRDITQRKQAERRDVADLVISRILATSPSLLRHPQTAGHNR